MNNINRYIVLLLIAVPLGACTPIQVVQVQEYHEKISRACNLAMAFVPPPDIQIVSPIIPLIVENCGNEAAIAKLALDPSSLEWLNGLIYKARGY